MTTEETKTMITITRNADGKQFQSQKELATLTNLPSSDIGYSIVFFVGTGTWYIQGIDKVFHLDPSLFTVSFTDSIAKSKVLDAINKTYFVIVNKMYNFDDTLPLPVGRLPIADLREALINLKSKLDLTLEGSEG